MLERGSLWHHRAEQYAPHLEWCNSLRKCTANGPVGRRREPFCFHRRTGARVASNDSQVILLSGGRGSLNVPERLRNPQHHPHPYPQQCGGHPGELPHPTLDIRPQRGLPLELGIPEAQRHSRGGPHRAPGPGRGRTRRSAATAAGGAGQGSVREQAAAAGAVDRLLLRPRLQSEHRLTAFSPENGAPPPEPRDVT